MALRSLIRAELSELVREEVREEVRTVIREEIRALIGDEAAGDEASGAGGEAAGDAAQAVPQFELNEAQTMVSFVVGRKGTGKTTLVKDLLARAGDSEITVVGSHHDYEGVTCRDYSDEFIISYLDEQQEELRARGYEDTTHKVLVLEQDCEINWKLPALRRMMFSSRTLKISMIVVAGYMMGIPPEMRAQFKYAFFFREPSKTSRNRIWNSFGGTFKTQQEFEQTFARITATPHQTMVVDNQSGDIFRYCASPSA